MDNCNKRNSSQGEATPKAYRTKGEEILALEEDCEMPRLLDKLNANGIIFQLTEKMISYEDKDNPRNWR